jgi:DNA-binding NarL/FixJ family response regulator
MPIKVLLADNSDVVRSVIKRLLVEDPDLHLVGEAASFAEILELTAALKPDIVLLDLHMSDEREYPPQTVKTKLLKSTECILAISIWDDADANALAQSLGARALLDKTNLYSTLIPAVKKFCAPNRSEAAGESVQDNQAVSAVSSSKDELSGPTDG